MSTYAQNVARTVDVLAGATPVVSPGELEVVSLDVGVSLREGGVSAAHVERLRADPGRWGPLLVSSRSGRVLDGQHRTLAATSLGLRRLAVLWFEGDAEEEYLEFVRANLRSPLPLARGDRQRAARLLLARQPQSADRLIGALSGVSPKTVARLRTRVEGEGAPSARVGRDGRVRPLDAAAQRARIVDALLENPDASLRTIARELEVSPETVRRLRIALDQQCGSIAESDPFTLGNAGGTQWNGCGSGSSEGVLADGSVALAFLERSVVTDSDIDPCAEAVPLSRVYEIADEARRRAAAWHRLADLIERRVRHRR